ncbi:zinc finger protein 346 isoform X7 [Equus przewalskii]|uniref:Zinc finger protein 346 n=1 Tax=Equus przewalskii TaxID=9798 RepID=A0ABM2F256_EQUPR|nr:PREDICTED: zinc finger protein 346 isoform X7 [Equus przewalskii]XP_023472921.1 zinc finger protein 346 isoform X8 [Equus caballus]
MEYPALGAAEAADSGGARLYNSSEEREGREPDGLRFDREKARRLWEAVSGAQPVGREEVEHMIQKNQCLFTNTQCKVCCALLISESQKLAHYQKSSRSKDKNQCCPICNMTFSSPVVAQSHYLGKTHAKNLKLKQQSTKVEALSKRLTNPFLVASTLALHQNREMIDPDKFCSLCHATFNDPVMAQQHYVGKKHRKQETKLKLMAHYGRLADPAVTDSSGSVPYAEESGNFGTKLLRTPLHKMLLFWPATDRNSIASSWHDPRSPKTVASPLSQIPVQRQPIQKDSATLED